MIPANKQPAFLSFLTTTTTPYTYADPGQSPITLPVNEWYSGGSDAVCAVLLNSLTFGVELGKTVGRATISRNDLVAELAQGAEFPTMDTSRIDFLINGHDSFPLNHAGMVSAMDAALASYPGVAAKFDGIKMKDASVAESIAETAGFSVTSDDVSALRNL